MTIRNASEQFKVPYETLRRKIKVKRGKQDTEKLSKGLYTRKPGPNRSYGTAFKSEII